VRGNIIGDDKFIDWVVCLGYNVELMLFLNNTIIFLFILIIKLLLFIHLKNIEIKNCIFHMFYLYFKDLCN
jgi:hypothetical protein